MVLIESELQTQPALPVLKRGDTDQGVDTLLGPFAVLEKAYFGMDQDPILKPRPISLPAARLGLAVILGGRNLSGEGGLLRFRHSRLDVSHELSPEPADVSAKELKIRLPEPGSGTSQTDWAPGVYTVTVLQNRPGTDRECTSNALPIPLSPIITAIEPGTTIARDDDGAATLTITCRPRVRAEQRTVLLVAGREITGTIDDDDPDKIVFVMEDAEAVTDAIIRLRVDGIESMPFSREDAPPPPHFVFDPQPAGEHHMNDLTKWQTNNDRYLVAAMAWLRLGLSRLANGSASDQPPENRKTEPPAPLVDETPRGWFGMRKHTANKPAPAAEKAPDNALATAAAAMAEAAKAEPPPAMIILGRCLGLSTFEQQILLLCAAMELDTRIPALCAQAQAPPEPGLSHFRPGLWHFSTIRPGTPFPPTGPYVIGA